MDEPLIRLPERDALPLGPVLMTPRIPDLTTRQRIDQLMLDAIFPPSRDELIKRMVLVTGV